MAFVIDASAVLNWHFPDERNERGDVILRKLELDEALTPAIFWFELRNVLLLGERRGRGTQEATIEFIDFLGRLAIEITPLRAEDEDNVFTLARRHRLTFYDAAYLELAQREGIALATLDKALAAAAKAEGIALIGA